MFVGHSSPSVPDEFLKDVHFEALTESPYLKSAQLTFKLAGIDRRWELAMRHASVAVLLFHTERQQFLTVRQFRPAIFVGETRRRPEFQGKDFNEIPWSTLPISRGYSLELCAGIIDKPGLTTAQIAKEEVIELFPLFKVSQVEEECGYLVEENQLRHVATYFGGVNESGAPQHLFYTEIDESMQADHSGGGVITDGEYIDKIWITVDEARALLTSVDDVVPGGLLFSFHWWFHRRDELKPASITAVPSSLDPSPITLKHGFGEITDIHLGENVKKTRCDPVRMRFKRRGRAHAWDMSPANDIVAVLIRHRTSGNILLVHRFRPAMLVGRLKHAVEHRGKPIGDLPLKGAETALAITIELVDGNFPQEEGAEPAARRVVRDKMGFEILELQKMACASAGVSQGGNRGHIFYAEVDGESTLTVETKPWDVETVSLNEDEVKAVLASNFLPASPTLFFALAWYRTEKLGKEK